MTKSFQASIYPGSFFLNNYQQRPKTGKYSDKLPNKKVSNNKRPLFHIISHPFTCGNATVPGFADNKLIIPEYYPSSQVGWEYILIFSNSYNDTLQKVSLFHHNYPQHLYGITTAYDSFTNLSHLSEVESGSVD